MFNRRPSMFNRRPSMFNRQPSPQLQVFIFKSCSIEGLIEVSIEGSSVLLSLRRWANGVSTEEIFNIHSCASKAPSGSRNSHQKHHQMKIKVPCSCCYIGQTLELVPRRIEISKQSVLYKLERTTSILPGKCIMFQSMIHNSHLLYR